jgi:Zn-dependent M28 family amino/carboxypeptidase
MARVVLAAAFVCACAGAAPAEQAKPTAPAAKRVAAAKFDSARAWAHLERQVKFGPRPAGSPALADTRKYLIGELKALGLVVREQAFVGKTPAGDVPMVNLIATIPGRRPDRIVVASHYDTKRAPFRFVGANDGASSTAVALELARVLRDSAPELTLEVLLLDGEEAVNWDWAGTDNTYGSRHYVSAGQADGSLKSLKALVLLDMVGDVNLMIRRESLSTPWLVDVVWAAAARLGHRAVFSSELTTVEDDHVAFLRAGVPAVDIIDLDNPTWHTAEDDLKHVSQKSLQIVGDVVLAALPDIQQRLAQNSR